jgi:hypothetical protein
MFCRRQFQEMEESVNASSNELSRLVKVVYFDEDAASDYIDLAMGGREERVLSDENSNDKSLSANAEAKLSAKIPFWSFFRAEAGTGGEFNVSEKAKNIVSQTISNTILTDYTKKVAESSLGVKKFEGYDVKFVDSLSCMRLYLPYEQINGTAEDFKDIKASKQSLDEIKGYYEMLGVRKDRRLILRFNHSAFRNNYSCPDMLSMNLTFYAVKVGETTLFDLRNEKENMSPSAKKGQESLEEERQSEEDLEEYRSHQSKDEFTEFDDITGSVPTADVPVALRSSSSCAEKYYEQKLLDSDGSDEGSDERESLEMYDVVLAGVEVSVLNDAN